MGFGRWGRMTDGMFVAERLWLSLTGRNDRWGGIICSENGLKVKTIEGWSINEGVA